MGHLQRFGLVASMALACATPGLAAQGPPALVGVMTGAPDNTPQGVLIRCAWPGGAPSTRVLFEGESACGRFTLVGVDGLTALVRDRASGVDLHLDLPPGAESTRDALRLTPTASPPRPQMPVIDTHAAPGEVHVRLRRADLDAYLRNLPALLSGVVVQPYSVPTAAGPRIDGFELRSVADGGLVAALGLRTGDILLELNGARLTTPSLVPAALEGLTLSGHATALVRRGETRVAFVVDVE